MEDQAQLEAGGGGEPPRSRWTPKPEQIVILESIFNSGMVNPPKDETVRIRRLLEKFGAVGDANVFYWFQNRRSRSRRRQRRIQATLGAAGTDQQPQTQQIPYDNSMTTTGGFVSNPFGSAYIAGSGFESGSSSSFSFGVGTDHASEHVLSFSGNPPAMQEFDQHYQFGDSETSNVYKFQSESTITVFINGVATEVGQGPLDLRAMFGGDFMLYHSYGVPVEVNEYGFLVQALHHGESYFLVPRNG